MNHRTVRTLFVALLALPGLMACSSTDEGSSSTPLGQTAGGAAGSGTAGSGTAGSGTAGSGTAGSGTAGSGTAGSGTAGAGTAGSGTAGSGTAGSGTGGSGGTAGAGGAPADKACGQAGLPDCAPNEFCDFADTNTCGGDGKPGLCKPRPEGCTAECSAEGVCGCDGKSYCTACVANANGVDVTGGPCGGAGGAGGGSGGKKVCGGKSGFTCAPNEFCDFPEEALCGATDQMGFCSPRPEACAEGCPPPEFWACACDGKKYCNECAANQAGFDVALGSVCGGGSAGAGGGSGGGQPCGQAGLPDCAPNEFCDFADTNTCGGDGSPGTCQPRPEACPLGCSLEGICGCDGKTYCNPCEAQANGVDVTGAACGGGSAGAGGGSGGKICGGFAGIECAPNEFCDFPDEAMCGAGDQTGICVPRPEVCAPGCPAPEFQPCACDGKKYCNACAANQAGADVAPAGFGCK